MLVIKHPDGLIGNNFSNLTELVLRWM
uniref:Uncharacterized protein n=1 Tax=Rhizophora mucronata TaxID=61149 RepID=A0A2P2R4X9_RHIMU